MSEHFSACPNTAAQLAAAEQIGEDALTIVDQIYGSGYPLWAPGETALSYHNGHHGRQVGEAAVKVCAQFDLEPVDLAIAAAAGKAHDIVQLKGRGTDEGDSAQWLDFKMVERQLFTPEQRETGRLAILGTQPRFADGRLVGQAATEQAYPTLEAEIVGLSVASADLGQLYTPEGPLLSHELFREINGMASDEDLPFEKMTAFQQGQVALIENYRYPLETAEQVLATHRSEVTAYSHDILAKLERGDISTWAELQQHDAAFIQMHR